MNKRAATTPRNTELRVDGLTLVQLNAVDVLASGKNDTETAALVGVHRVTVTKWRRYDRNFQAALNRKRADVWAVGIDRLRSLLPKAVTTLGDLLEHGEPEVRLKAALNLMKLCAVNSESFAIGSTDAEELLNQETMRRRVVSKKITTEDLLAQPFHCLPPARVQREEVRVEFARALIAPDPPPETTELAETPRDDTE